MQPIWEVYLKDAELGRELARAPWLADGIGTLEPNAVYGLSNLFDADPALARQVLAYSSEEPVRSRNVLLLNALGDMSREMIVENRADFEVLTRQPWFTDGLDQEERAFVIAVKNVRGVDSLYRDLLASYYTQSKTISLPLAGEVTLWAFYNDPPPDENILAVMERGARGAERLMGAPFPLTDLIVLSVNVERYGLPYGGVNFVDALVLLREKGLSLGEGILYHEISHFYLAFEIGPPWLFEGGANFASEYVKAWAGSEDWDGRIPVSEDSITYCLDRGVPNIHALSAPNHPDRIAQGTCNYSFGQYFMTSLFNAIGESAFSAAMRDLYESYLDFRYYPTEEHIYRTFLKHTPPDREAAFRDLYRRLHGGPFLDQG